MRLPGPWRGATGQQLDHVRLGGGISLPRVGGTEDVWWILKGKDYPRLCWDADYN